MSNDTKIFALSNIKYNGKTFARGDEVLGVDDKQAKILLDTGAAQTEPVETDVETEEVIDTGEGENITPNVGGETAKETGEPSIDGAETTNTGTELGPDENKSSVFGNKNADATDGLVDYVVKEGDTFPNLPDGTPVKTGDTIGLSPDHELLKDVTPAPTDKNKVVDPSLSEGM